MKLFFFTTPAFKCWMGLVLCTILFHSTSVYAQFSVVYSKNNTSCFGSSSGSINLYPSGGQTPYHYIWSNGAITMNIDNLTAGNYEVTVCDNNSYPLPELPWTYINTGYYHGVFFILDSIIVPTGFSLESGDYIGVFFEDGTNEVCGGFAEYNSNVQTCFVKAWGDDISTSNKDGFNFNEPFIWKLWKSYDGQLIDLSITYMATSLSQGNFLLNGISYVDSVSGSYVPLLLNKSVHSITIDQPDQLEVGFTLSDYNGFNTSSANLNDGFVQSTVSGGISPYQFIWSTGEITSNLDSVFSGCYFLTVSDANQCEYVDSVIITQPPFEQDLQISGLVTNESCAQENDGSIDLSISGGTPFYQYFWNDSVTSEDRDSLEAGIYTVTVTDQLPDTSLVFSWYADSSYASHSLIIQDSSVFVNQELIGLGDAVGVFYSENGSFHCGGYSMFNGYPISFLAFADDTLTSTKDGFVEGEAFIWKVWRQSDGIIVNMTPSYSSFALSSCFAQNGQTTLDSLVGTFNWQGGIQTKVMEFEVTQPLGISVDASILSLDTFLNTLGSISITIDEGNPPYSYFWSTGSTDQEINNLDTGTYSLTITDSINCSYVRNYHVAIKEYHEMESDYTQYNVNCFGGSTGSLIGSVTKGVPPYSYIWSNGATTENIDSLTAGIYWLTVTDFLQITDSFQFEINEPDLFEHNPEVTYDCQNGTNSSIRLFPSGGVAPYSYQWSNGVTTGQVEGLIAGTYWVVFSDNKGCQLADTFTILEPIFPNAIIDSIGCDNACNGGISLNITGGTSPYNVIWSTGDTDVELNNLCPGSYSVSIQDTSTIYPDMPWSYNLGLPSNHTIVINPGTVNLSGDPIEVGDLIGVFYNDNGILKCSGYTEWTGDVTTVTAWSDDPYDSEKLGFEGGEAFNWKVWKTDENREVSMTATYSSAVQYQGYFEWNGISVIAGLHGNLTAVPYQYQVVHEFNLPGYDTMTVGSTITLIDTLFNVMGEIDLTVSGGSQPYSYVWSNGFTSQDLITDTAGTFFLTITDAQLCSEEFQFAVDYEPYAPMLVDSLVWGASCAGYSDGSVELVLTSGYPPYAVLWQDGDTALLHDSLVAGLYQVTVSDLVDVFVFNFQVTEPDPLTLTPLATNIDTVYSQIGQILSNPDGGSQPYAFLWSDGSASQNFSTYQSGWYYVTVVDAKGCLLTAGAELVHNDYLPMSFAHVVQDVRCYGDSSGLIEMDVTGGAPPIEYSWSNGGSDYYIDSLPAGIYTLEVSDMALSYFFTFEILQPDSLWADVLVTPHNLGTGTPGTIDITVSGGTTPYYYVWSNGTTDQDIALADSGIYSLTVTDVNLCGLLVDAYVEGLIIPPWYITQTQSQHFIDFSNSSTILLNGSSFDTNDFVGVFYDSAGTEACGGYLQWQGQVATMVAYGDILSTPQVEGFAAGEEFTWKVWDFSENMVYDAYAVYTTSHPNLQYFAQSGNSGIDSLYTNSISGLVATTSKGLLPKGMVVVYEQTADGYFAVDKGLVENGSFVVGGLEQGSYICYAVPEPGNGWGIPGYYPSNQAWQQANWVQAYANTTGINITLDPVLPYNTGLASISGSISVGSDQSYNPEVFDCEWFPPSTKNNGTPARNIPVLLYDSLQNAIDFRLTNEQGEFLYENLEFGKYYVRAEKAGSYAELVEVVLDIAHPISDSVNFELNQGQVNGVEMLLENPDVSIFPNPTNGQLTIVLSNGFGEPDMVEVYSQLGQKQHISMIEENNGGLLRLDVSGLASGIYVIKILGSKENRLKKFIKQ